MSQDVIPIAGTPAVPGLVFRHYAGASDLPAMADISNRANAADNVPEIETVEFLTNMLKFFVKDARREFLMAQVGDEMVGWARVWVRQQNDGPRYFLGGAIVPEWRRRGIGSAIVDWQEAALRGISQEQASAAPRLFQAWTPTSRVGKVALFHNKGYTDARFSFDMQRADLENLPPIALPRGIEVRPAAPSQFRKIWQAKEEAFQGQWGSYRGTEAHYQMWLQDPHFDPTLWQVAWAGDEIVGSALNIIKPAAENADSPSGVIEELTVARGWRKRGLGGALLAASFHTFKSRGLTQAEISVDSQNESGALRLYESVGFRTLRTAVVLQKEF